MLVMVPAPVKAACGAIRWPLQSLRACVRRVPVTFARLKPRLGGVSMPSRVFTSSVATKILVGLTGLALVVYLVIHVVGNLLVFLGPEFFNTYAHTLESNPLIPVIEVGLLLIFLLHVYKTIGLVLRNRRARPVAYAEKSMAGKPLCPASTRFLTRTPSAVGSGTPGPISMAPPLSWMVGWTRSGSRRVMTRLRTGGSR